MSVLEDISDDEDEEEDEKLAADEELSRLKGCLDRAKNSIAFLKERERKLKDRLVSFLLALQLCQSHFFCVFVSV